MLKFLILLHDLWPVTKSIRSDIWCEQIMFKYIPFRGLEIYDIYG